MAMNEKTRQAALEAIFNRQDWHNTSRPASNHGNPSFRARWDKAHESYHVWSYALLIGYWTEERGWVVWPNSTADSATTRSHRVLLRDAIHLYDTEYSKAQESHPRTRPVGPITQELNNLKEGNK